MKTRRLIPTLLAANLAANLTFGPFLDEAFGIAPTVWPEPVFQEENFASISDYNAYKELESMGFSCDWEYSKPHYKGSMDERVTITQGEFAVISARVGEKRCVNTIGIASCIGVTIYDAQSKVAALAHLDVMTVKENSISEMIRMLNKLGGKNYSACVFANPLEDPSGILSVVKALEKNAITLIFSELSYTPERSIAISADGALYAGDFMADEKQSLLIRTEIAALKRDPYTAVCFYSPR